MAKNTMPSAKAVLRMACTRIGVEAPGLRPTASAPFIPMKPTPIAAPSAARPTCRLPLISANIGVNIVFLSLLSQRLPRLNTVKPPKSHNLLMCPFVSFFMLANQQRENGCQEHEHERLNQ